MKKSLEIYTAFGERILYREPNFKIYKYALITLPDEVILIDRLNELFYIVYNKKIHDISINNNRLCTELIERSRFKSGGNLSNYDYYTPGIPLFENTYKVRIVE